MDISLGCIICPECQGKTCDFCHNTGKIYYYPSDNADDRIEIARAEYRIKKRG